MKQPLWLNIGRKHEEVRQSWSKTCTHRPWMFPKKTSPRARWGRMQNTEHGGGKTLYDRNRRGVGQRVRGESTVEGPKWREMSEKCNQEIDHGTLRLLSEGQEEGESVRTIKARSEVSNLREWVMSAVSAVLNAPGHLSPAYILFPLSPLPHFPSREHMGHLRQVFTNLTLFPQPLWKNGKEAFPFWV